MKLGLLTYQVPGARERFSVRQRSERRVEIAEQPVASGNADQRPATVD
jgi:hypothetical protein